MVGISEVGRGATVAARLVEIAGPELYRRNAFRITGLPTDASARAVRECRQKVTTQLAVGAFVHTGGDLPLPAPATTHQINTAFDDLSDAQRRLVEELFWFWDTPDAGCPCASGLHGYHDAALRAHAHALDVELGVQAGTADLRRQADELWIDAAERWTSLLRRAEFWNHVRHRMHALDDRRLDESTITTIRDALPRALVKPAVDLAAAADQPTRMSTHATRWFTGQHVADDLIAAAAEPLHRTITTLTSQAAEQLDEGRPRDAANATRQTVLPALRRLEGLAPRQRHRGTATAHNAAASLLNNCAIALIDGPAPLPRTEIRKLLDLAHKLATKDETRRVITSNQELLDYLVQQNQYLAPYGHRGPVSKSPASNSTLEAVAILIGTFVCSFLFGVIAFVIYDFVGALAGVIAFVVVGVCTVGAIYGAIHEARAKHGEPR